MAKKITEIVTEELSDFLSENGLELYNTEFVKEGKDWFLRVYIEKTVEKSKDEEGNPVYVSTDDCELTSRFLSKRLDELDPIEQNYYLEVSSPGMDRELVKEEHYIRYIGEIVDVKLYKGFEGSKTYEGILKAFTAETLILSVNEKELEIPRELISKTRLAVII